MPRPGRSLLSHLVKLVDDGVVVTDWAADGDELVPARLTGPA